MSVYDNIEKVKQLTRSFVKAWRPFSLTAAIIPTSLGSAVAAIEGKFDWLIFVLLTFGGLFLQSGVNLINDFFEFKQGILPEKNPNLKLTFKSRMIYEYFVFVSGTIFFILSAPIGIYLAYSSGICFWIICFIGLVGAYFYTGKPFSYKDKGLGLVFVFFLMGVLMVIGSYYAFSSEFSTKIYLISLPISCLVSLLLLSNEIRDIDSDRENNLRTTSVIIGLEMARKLYLYLMLAPFIITLILVYAKILPLLNLLVFIALPLGIKIFRLTYTNLPERRKIVTKTALLHFIFGCIQILTMLFARSHFILD